MRKVCHVCRQEAEHKSWKANTCNVCLDNGVKWCPDCASVHDIANFHKNGKVLRSVCKSCECKRSKTNHDSNNYYSRPEVMERRNEASSKSKRKRYASDEEYRNKELQRCRVREATKESRGYYSVDEWYSTLDKFDFSCAYCGATTRITREHIVPLVSGGMNTIDNVIPACLSCNASKSDTELTEWYTKQVFYDKNRLQAIIKYMKASKVGGGAECHI